MRIIRVIKVIRAHPSIPVQVWLILVYFLKNPNFAQKSQSQLKQVFSSNLVHSHFHFPPFLQQSPRDPPKSQVEKQEWCERDGKRVAGWIGRWLGCTCGQRPNAIYEYNMIQIYIYIYIHHATRVFEIGVFIYICSSIRVIKGHIEKGI